MRFLACFLLIFMGCASPVTLTGKPVTIFAIGGETTGTGLEVGDTMIETDISKISEEITVTGYWETRHGVERNDYKVLVVETIEQSEKK